MQVRIGISAKLFPQTLKTIAEAFTLKRIYAAIWDHIWSVVQVIACTVVIAVMIAIVIVIVVDILVGIVVVNIVIVFVGYDQASLTHGFVCSCS